MSTEFALAQHGLIREEDQPLSWHNLIDCRAFAKVVWVDKVILKVELGFNADHLHDILHANDDYFYDVCPGEAVVKKWFKEFFSEVA